MSKVLILGKNGRLAQSIKNAHMSEYEVESISSNFFSRSVPKKDEIPRALVETLIEEHDPKRIFYCFGITNPTEKGSLIHFVNTELALTVAELANSLNIPTALFGSISEYFEGFSNSYVESKRQLTAQLSANHKLRNVSHFHLATLYGGVTAPPRHMFLGQILDSIVHKRKFMMSSGSAIREYQHVDDIALSVKKSIDLGITGKHTISFAPPIKIGFIASEIFQHFNSSDLLDLGAISEIDGENYSKSFHGTLPPDILVGREQVPGIVGYLEKFI